MAVGIWIYTQQRIKIRIGIADDSPTFHIYGAHFYVSMKDRAILGPPLGPHKLSNIYASPLEVVWWRTVEPLQSNGQKNLCCRRGEPLPNAEWLPNLDPALSQAGTNLLWAHGRVAYPIEKTTFKIPKIHRRFMGLLAT